MSTGDRKPTAAIGKIISAARTKIISVLLLAGMTLAVSSCGLGSAGGYIPGSTLAGDIANTKSLEGASITVGSKNFSESVIIGKMVGILVKSGGATVYDKTNIPGSVAARQALISGEVDMMSEYTGTAWLSYMGEEKPIRDPREQYEAVRDRELKENNLVWLEPAPLNNTYGFAVTKESADRLGIDSLSDIADLPEEERTFCIESEFASRDDGFRPMLKAYGMTYGKEIPESNVKIYDTGAIYEATAQGDCVFGEVFTTDGRILALDLQIMKDDKQFFPNYNVSPVFRKETIDEYPQLADMLNPVFAKLTDETVIKLNAKVDVDGEAPADVAEEWLRSEGFIR